MYTRLHVSRDLNYDRCHLTASSSIAFLWYNKHVLGNKMIILYYDVTDVNIFVTSRSAFTFRIGTHLDVPFRIWTNCEISNEIFWR